ncbi:MAG: membrane dipeptidase [Gemmatimonas sp.]|nr:membrane dipeptidase [Gemmatimonas sp.]
MRYPSIVFALIAAAAAASCTVAQTDDPALVAQAREIHDRVTTLDTHVDINPDNFLVDQPNYVNGLETQVDLPKMEEGGLDAAFFSIFQGQQDDFTPEGYQQAHDLAVAKVEAIHRLTSELAPDRIGLALTAADVPRLQAEGKMVALMGMENGYALGEDITNVKKFADMGVRYLSLAHSGFSQLSDSHAGETEGYRWNGLSPLGREVISEANRWGVMIDISHPSKQANLQAMELTRAPVIASHSAARALADHTRNLDDEQLLALQRNGGVVQVVAFDSYLTIAPEPTPERVAALTALGEEFGLPNDGGVRAALRTLAEERRAEYESRMEELDRDFPPPPWAAVSDLVDHIDYVVDLIGIDHVGISSDFDGGGGIDGWDDATETFNVTLELVRRGYTEEEITKIWSGNLLRVMSDVELVAAELNAASPE